VCANGHYKKILPLLHTIGVKVLFATQAVKNESYGDMTILPILHHPVSKARPAKKKDILYSFIGYVSHSFRKKIFCLPRKNDIVLTKRRHWHLGSTSQKIRIMEAEEYQNVIARSRFGLCPRGYFPGSIRLPELLYAGAIPVILADDICLPAGVDWSKCVIQVKEDDLANVDKIIRSIPSHVEEDMRRVCLAVSKLITDDPAYFIRYYFKTLEQETSSAKA